MKRHGRELLLQVQQLIDAPGDKLLFGGPLVEQKECLISRRYLVRHLLQECLSLLCQLLDVLFGAVQPDPAPGEKTLRLPELGDEAELVQLRRGGIEQCFRCFDLAAVITEHCLEDLESYANETGTDN